MASRVTTFIVVLIVVGTLIAGHMVGAERDDEDGPVDLIITNAQVFTGGPGGELAEAIAIRANKILKVGSNRDIKRLRRPHTLTLDAHGATVLPGFNDSHAHLLSGGLAISQLDLIDAKSLDTIKDAIRAYAGAHPDRPWIRRSRLVRTSRSRACRRGSCSISSCPIARRSSRPTTATRAGPTRRRWRLAHITRRTKNPTHGTIVKDARTGEPTGALSSRRWILSKRLGLSRRATRSCRPFATAILAGAHASGSRACRTRAARQRTSAFTTTLRRNGELDLRVYPALSMAVRPVPRPISTDSRRSASSSRDDPLLKAGAVKLFVDGVVESHTAALLAPYANEQDRGHAGVHAGAAHRVSSPTLDERGWQVFAHAIGDRAIRTTLDAYQHAAQVNPASDRGRRHRIEHIETLDPADIPRFASIGVVASMQPYHGDPAPDLMTVWKTTLGDERASRGWMPRKPAECRRALAFGSDWPVVVAGSPASGCTRRHDEAVAERRAGGRLASRTSSIPLSDALRAYTAGRRLGVVRRAAEGHARARHAGRCRSSSRPRLRARRGEVLDTVRSAVTIFDGRVVYDRAAKPQTD